MSMGQNTAAADALTAYMERMERLLDEIEGLKDDLKDVQSEARNEGYNIAALNRLVAIRRNKRRADREMEMLNDLILYAHATGTPLELAFGEADTSPGPTPAGPAAEPDTSQ